MTLRELSGMRYYSVEVQHSVSEPMPNILRQLATWLDSNDHEHGILTSVATQGNPDDEREFLTTLVWAY